MLHLNKIKNCKKKTKKKVIFLLIKMNNNPNNKVIATKQRKIMITKKGIVHKGKLFQFD